MTGFEQRLDEALLRAAESVALAQSICRELAGAENRPERRWRGCCR